MTESIIGFDNATVSNPATMPSEMFHPEAVSAVNKCQTSEARRLVIYDLFRKLINTDIYHIGGTYTNDNPDLWFYYSLSACPGGNFLLSLFTCHRSSGVFSIGISEGSEFTQKRDCPQSLYSSETLSWQTYLSGQANENHYIKTFKFNKSKMETWENKFLCIPIKIETNCQQILNNNIVKQIKVAHDFGDVLTKEENTDFILVSITKRQFPVHQAILAVHSPVLRDLIKSSSSKTALIDLNDHDMELLLQFIYTGTIKEVHQVDCLNLLEIADKFQLKNLVLLTQHVIKEQIDLKNAVEVAV
ncbi:uncharacterized protein LOC113233166 [Hyposmocoma kahamanoa]|uniref:uncharacterized protein LOC113233166 n=1 Tax=Hyposmocoma kahamanoa TaxID=1477025 RepID=UPI000E6D67AA|nr:uncharacterized protein LOC113233166 [Hyposmocoma kahamanoa]